ncbi:uncharacterized protein BXZ73DRAFT_46253 [Epithele typhae]|uniref:uncharacterized protein n=1 Tax=Epithele typhae TaxID=378194 RepID=UPI0020077837|nr:uncharacterized protein BXZ73DRAFT_46253 [Epithele typhae]KAH9933560.1 hypothetical protein BXZ73DRAFT_46253 [Epithele typhae]
MTASTSISVDASAHPVKVVTVFQSSTAEVTRALTLQLQAGKNVVEILNLSSLMDLDSPRVHGLSQGVRVFDITCSNRLKDAPGPPASRRAEELKRLHAKKKGLEDERGLLVQQSELINETGAAIAKSGKDQTFDLQFVEKLTQRKREILKATALISERLAEVERELWTVKNTVKGETIAVVTVTLIALHECLLAIQLTYLVSKVSWMPYYDLYATTSEGKTSSEISMVYRASIRQSTGEDWDDVKLTLSTANSQTRSSLSVPTIDRLKLSALRPPPAPEYRSHAPMAMIAPMSRMPVGRKKMAVMPTEPESLPDVSVIDEYEEVPATTLDRSALSLSYRVEEVVTIASDGLAHKVAIAPLTFTAELRYVCVPKKTPAAFIEATIKNTSEYELLAGPVSVYMDDGFVTKTSLGLIGVNQSFECILGVDTALRITFHTRSQVEREAARSFAEPLKTTTQTVTTTVTNRHAFDVVGLVVRDSLPLGDSEEKIKVMLRKPADLAQARDGQEVSVALEGDVSAVKVRWSKVEDGKGGEKDGMYEWVCRVAEGKKVELEAQWDIKTPADLQWEERVEGK